MKRYKFKVGEVVSTLGMSPNPSWENFRLIVITKRKRIADNNYYEADLFINSDLKLKYYVDSDFPEFNGDYNYLIEEKYLYPKNYRFKFDYPICKNNGCELVDSFLNNESDEKEFYFKKQYYESLISISIEIIDSYKIAINELNRSIDREENVKRAWQNELYRFLIKNNKLKDSDFLDTIEE